MHRSNNVKYNSDHHFELCQTSLNWEKNRNKLIFFYKVTRMDGILTLQRIIFQQQEYIRSIIVLLLTLPRHSIQLIKYNQNGTVQNKHSRQIIAMYKTLPV